MKKNTSTFKFTAAIATVIVGVLALCAWLGHSVLVSYLSSTHTYNGVEVTPYGHRMEGLLTHSFDSIAVKQGNSTYVVRKLDFDLTVVGDSKGLALKADAVELDIKSTENSKDKQDSATGPPSIPEELKFYLPVSVEANSLSVKVDSAAWTAKDISIRSEGEHQVRVKARDIEGDNIAQKTSVEVAANFSGQKVYADGQIEAGSDSVHVNVAANKSNLTEVSTQVNLDVNNPEEWLPFKLPEAVPPIGKLKVSGSARLDARKNPYYDVTIQTRVGAFWPLKTQNVNLHLKGGPQGFHAVVNLRDDEGGHIFAEGDVDKNWDFKASGKVTNLSAMFGPQMMPMDMIIHSASKEGDVIRAKAETRQGSIVEATINLKDKFRMTYTGDMSPYEQWALDWSKGRLVLKERFKVYGTVEDAKTRILVKIPNVYDAYEIRADSLQTVLLIDKNGIDFSDGIIYSPKETFDFTGDVKWNGKGPHTSWEVIQRHGGVARAYVSILDSISLDVTADSVEISTIPFANFKLNEKLSGKVTGHWFQNFDKNNGVADVSFDGNFEPFNLQAHVKGYENNDTVFVEKAEAVQNKNRVEAEGAFILPNDSNPDFNPTGTLPIQVLHAWVMAKDFNIPLLLEPLNDTTLTSGFITGDLAYNEGGGLQGNIDFTDLKFGNIPSHLLSINKMNLFAEGDKMELNAYLDIGSGGWTGSTQIILDDIFKPKRHVSISHNSDNGGDLYAEGFIDSLLVFNGKMNMNGSWFIPGTLSEIQRTDIVVDVSADIRNGLNGITADIRADSTLFKPQKLNYKFPVRMRGHLENGILDVSEASTQNDSGETISGKIRLDLDKFQVEAFDVESKLYSIRTASHTVVVENVSGHLEDTEENMVLSAQIPTIRYLFHNETYGDAEALGHSNLYFAIPHAKEGIIENKTIGGELVVDRLLYRKNIEIEMTPSSLDKFISMFHNAVARVKKSETQEAKISTARPINLALHISDSQQDSIQILTPFATFPFTFDFWVMGSTNRPLLRGDLSNSNAGFIGVKDIYQFDLNSFRITWTDAPWQQGNVDVSSAQELPYCNETEENENETCPINLDIQGTLSNPQATPSSNCGNESSSAAIYYNIFLGCIAENTDESTDWNKLAGKAIGKVLSSTANKTLGGDYIGDIDMKVMLFNSNTQNEKDSSYFKLPISLDKWVKDLSLIFGYTQDQSENPTYDQALQFGVNYKLPVFKEKEYSHKNHLNPALSLNGQLVSKQYLTNTGTEGNENRIEKNVGINYTYRYWNPCLLGIGHCETISPRDTTQTKAKTEVAK